jgi:type IV pilus assembly protein PilX
VNTMPHLRTHLHRPQRGVVMLFGLIALLIMMLGAVAMLRSTSTTLTNTGNLGFKRDLTNQGERAVDIVLTLMKTGALSTDAARQATSTASNYSATLLASNAQGLPTVLVDDAAFGGAGSAGNDITVADMGVTLRWVVDRLCVNTGVATTSHCTMTDAGQPLGCSASDCFNLDNLIPQQVVYRLSIRVTGPRATQAFMQSTFTL